jgi:hypothetical protein
MTLVNLSTENRDDLLFLGLTGLGRIDTTVFLLHCESGQKWLGLFFRYRNEPLIVYSGVCLKSFIKR